MSVDQENHADTSFDNGMGAVLLKRAEEALSGLKAPLDLLLLEGALQNFRTALQDASAITRATGRELAVDRLAGAGVRSPAALVDAALAGLGGGKNAESSGTAIKFEDPEPWPDPVDVAALLEEIEAVLRRYMVLPERAYGAVALWILHTHAIDAADISPRLNIKSPEMQCGKTRLLSIVAACARKPLAAANVTAAAVFRVMEAFAPTLLVDEADSFLEANEELRGILNSGHSRATAFVPRCAGDAHDVKLFSTWGAVVIAAIGDIPGTLADRSIEVSMKRKAPGEKVGRLRRRDASSWAEPIRRKAWRWVEDNIEALKAAEPELPPELGDRDADNWEPLLAIADLAGEEWAKRAREVAVLLSGGRDGAVRAGDGVLLLGDIRTAFFTGLSGLLLTERSTDRSPTKDLLRALNSMDERPWPGWRKDKGL
ncbi:MAG TPA: DUF3631 domain-containing protein, partial [Planctomycetota bacterium]|nr:DUF3631 domain-containing protein [Planctomycetota bacterium]